MSKIVVDASALLAVLNLEPGSEKLSVTQLADASIGSVNLAEVHTKLVLSGMPAEEAWAAASGPIGEVVPFTEKHAKLVGDLAAQTRALGLSLGDRACLALAISVGAPVYTADRSWKKLRISVPIHVIR